MQNPIPSTVSHNFKAMQAAMSPIVDETKPLVIRLQGQDVLNNRIDFRLTDCTFIRLIHHIGKKIAYTHTGIVYTALDTVTLIIPNPADFLSQHQEQTTNSVASTFLQVFLRELWKYYPDVRFHAIVFSLDSYSVINEYLHYLQTKCQSEALHYYARDYLTPTEFSNANDADLILSLEIKKQYSKLAGNKDFYNGMTSHLTGI
jgi:tRNA(His) 5'-end guanylyltransferase